LLNSIQDGLGQTLVSNQGIINSTKCPDCSCRRLDAKRFGLNNITMQQYGTAVRKK
tara:strand:+ start:166 stop:333 length:168 start_codon:yes stop_codon:yes gene_type:complete